MYQYKKKSKVNNVCFIQPRLLSSDYTLVQPLAELSSLCPVTRDKNLSNSFHSSEPLSITSVFSVWVNSGIMHSHLSGVEAGRAGGAEGLPGKIVQ